MKDDPNLTREAGILAEGLHVARVERASELTQELCDHLVALDLRTDALDDVLRDMEGRHGDEAYGELLWILTNLRFDSGEAKRHWKGILKHRAAMERRLGTSLDLRVALFSFFVEIQRKLTNPKIIELHEFERTRDSAYTDQLTGLRNYRFFVEHLNHEVLRAEQYDTPLSLIMADIDRFKHFNDRHGHETGNEVLARIGRIIRRALRKVDVGVRYGGEEFILVLPSTPKAGAQLAAERLRAAIETHNFPHAAGQPRERVTASIGVATYPADAWNAAELVEHTDRTLYVAKATGRNRVCVFGGSTRSFPRIYVELDGRCRVNGAEGPMKTIQLGTGGMSFRTAIGLATGSLVDAEIELPACSRGIPVSGRVLRVGAEGDGWTEAAVRFVDVPPSDRRLLWSFVRAGMAPPAGASPRLATAGDG